jgi:ADP-ribose pyrophosphatase
VTANPPGAAADHGFEVTGTEITHHGVLTTLRVDTIRAPDGSVVEREIAERPNAVAMVPLTADGEVVLVSQYRHAVGRHELEIPAGLLDVDGEREEDAAQRELVEEIGMTAGTLGRLLCFHNSGGWSDEATVVFLATDLREADTDPGFEADAEEADMTVLRMPLDDAVAAVRRGEIRDAKTVIGLLLVAVDAAS